MVSENAKDLVKKMLDPDPKRRLTAQGVLGSYLIFLFSYSFISCYSDFPFFFFIFFK